MAAQASTKMQPTKRVFEVLDLTHPGLAEVKRFNQARDEDAVRTAHFARALVLGTNWLEVFLTNVVTLSYGLARRPLRRNRRVPLADGCSSRNTIFVSFSPQTA